MAVEASLNKDEANSPRDLLSKAFAQLTKRKREIEEHLGRFDDLRKELETIDAQIESLKSTVTLFGIADQSTSHPLTREVTNAEMETPGDSPAGGERLEFTGNKRDFITAIVKSRGAAGIAPKEIEKIFSDRKIEKSRNLIYNALSMLVKQRVVSRDNGRYSILAGKQSAAQKTRGISNPVDAPAKRGPGRPRKTT